MKIGKNRAVVLSIVAVPAIIYLGWIGSRYAQGEIDLKLRLNAGESYEMKLAQVQKVTRTIHNIEQKVTSQADITIDLNVLDADANGTMDIEFFYKTMDMSLNGPTVRLDFNSVKPMPPVDFNNAYQGVLTCVLSAMAENKFKMKVSPTGQISNISGFDTMISEIEKKIGEGFSSTVVSRLSSEVFASAQEDIKEMAGCVIVALSWEPVRIGEKWYGDISVNIGFPMNINTVYKLYKRRGGNAYVKMVSKFDSGREPKITKVDFEGKMLRQIKGQWTSLSVVDEDTGLLRKSETTMKFSGIDRIEADKSLVPPRPDAAIPTTVEGYMVIERVK